MEADAHATMNGGRNHGPLTGVRIIDITTVLMGPYATQILGDLGADIIKIETRDGDNVRGLGAARSPGMSAMFLHLNRNKRSLVLDLKTPEGRRIVLELIAGADVLIYNVRPQAMARLGLDYESVKAVNPRVLYVGVYGFGSGGPYAKKAAYDDLIQGAVGIPILSVEAGADVPRYAPVAIADRIVGMNAAQATTAALYHRQVTGLGQRIDVPMFETLAGFVLGDHMNGLTFAPPQGGPGYARLLNEYRKPYETADGHLCVVIYNDKQWRAFFNLIGQPRAMEEDPRLATIATRTEHIKDLYEMISEIMRTRTSAEWEAALESADIPVMRMHSMTTLMDDPHLNAVGFFTEVQHPTEGPMKSMAVSAQFSESAPQLRFHAPRLGQNSAEILRELGYADSDIADLVSKGVTVAPQG